MNKATNSTHSIDDIPLLIFNLTKLSSVLNDVYQSTKVKKSIIEDYSLKEEELENMIQNLKDKIGIK